LDQSRAMYPAWLEGLRSSGIDPEYRTSGLLVLPAYDLAKVLRWAQSSAEPVEELPARHLEPGLAFDSAGLWMPQVAQVRNPRLLRALRISLAQRGVTVHEGTPVTAWRTVGGRITGAQTPQAVLEADNFVIAAGAWSGAALGEYGAQLPIKPMRGQIVLYKSTPGRLQHMLYRDGFYLIPRDDGHILAGSTLEDVGFDKQVTDMARLNLMQRATELLPWLQDVPVVAHWAGLRPASPDNMPIISRHPEIENLFINSGHYRYGVTLAPASAQAVADLMLGRESPYDLSAFRWPN
jgi:glycine oxidase